MGLFFLIYKLIIFLNVPHVISDSVMGWGYRILSSDE